MNLKIFVRNAPETIDTGIIPGIKETLFVAYNISDVQMFENEMYKLQSLRTTACKEIAQYNLYPMDDIEILDTTVSSYCCNLNLLMNNSKYMKTLGQTIFSWIGLFTDQLSNSNDLKFETANFLLVLTIANLNCAINQKLNTRQTLEESLRYINRSQSTVNYMIEKEYVCENYEYISPTFINALSVVVEMIRQQKIVEILAQKKDNDRTNFYKLSEYSLGIIDICKKAKCMLTKVAVLYPNFPLPKSWFNFCDIGFHYYNGIALYYFAKSMNIMDESSKMLACLNQSIKYIESAIKVAENMKDDSLITIKDMYTKIKNYHKEIEYDNRNVYFRVVPTTLEGITLPDASIYTELSQFSYLRGDETCYNNFNLFGKLITNSQSNSDYAPYKAMLENLRDSTRTQVNKSNVELEEFLSRVNITTILEVKNGKNPSQDIIKSDILSMKTSCLDVTTLEENLNAHMKLSSDNAYNFQKLVEELHQKLDYIDPSIKGSIVKRKDSIEDALTQALQIDSHLKTTFQQYKLDFQLLFGPIEKLMATIPSIEPILKSKAINSGLKLFDDLMMKVDKMTSQRHRFLNELVSSVENDDFSSRIQLLDKSSHASHFKEQLKKYEYPINVLKQNIIAQSNIIEALQNAYNKCLSFMDEIKAIRYQQESRVSQIKKMIENYTQVNNEIKNGLELHRKVDLLVKNLFRELSKTPTIQPNRPYINSNYTPYQTGSTSLPQNYLPTSYEIPSRSLKPTMYNPQYQTSKRNNYDPNNPYPKL